MRTNGSRPGKAKGVIDPDLERQRCDRTDTGNGHQSPADRIVLNHLQKHPMELAITIEDRLAHVQHRLDHRQKDNIRAFDQLAELVPRNGPDRRPRPTVRRF